MKKKKKWIKLVIILLVIAIAARAIFVRKSHKAKAAAAAATAENTATVEKRSISSQLSSSGTLEAKDTYTVPRILLPGPRPLMQTHWMIITRQHRITAEIHIRQLIQAILRNCISAWEIKSAEIQSWQTSTVMI